MKLLRFLLPVALAAMSVALNLGNLYGEQPGGKTLFQQGALRSLIEAEQLMADGQAEEALSAWEVSALRAHRESLLATFDLIRHRIGLAGKLRWPRQSSAWDFMSRYALYGETFGLDAARVEGYILSASKPVDRFEYSLICADGKTTIWKDSPALVPAWLYHQLPGNFPLSSVPGLLYNVRVSQLPPGWDWVHVFPVALFGITPVPKTVLQVEGEAAAARKWLVSYHNAVQWDKSFSTNGANTRSLALEYKGVLNIDRIMAAGPRGKQRVTMTLVREYQPMFLKSP
jgi:hypothetical protein